MALAELLRKADAEPDLDTLPCSPPRWLKAWARLGDRRQTEVALDQGRSILAWPPYRDNHFMVDPAKFDLYAMDC
jgi:hypothetical protein